MLDIRIKLRSSLLGFEQSHLQDQSLFAAQQLARQNRGESEMLLKDILTGISDCRCSSNCARLFLNANSSLIITSVTSRCTPPPLPRQTHYNIHTHVHHHHHVHYHHGWWMVRN